MNAPTLFPGGIMPRRRYVLPGSKFRGDRFDTSQPKNFSKKYRGG
jgi:hypothetical protein